MATIKSYSDLQQSKKLAEILPLGSADMYYWCADHYPKEDWIIEVGAPDDNYECICAWSLTALLGVLPLVDFTTPQLIGTPKTLYRCIYNDDLKSHAYDNPVDACVDMIIRLNELNLL